MRKLARHRVATPHALTARQARSATRAIANTPTRPNQYALASTTTVASGYGKYGEGRQAQAMTNASASKRPALDAANGWRAANRSSLGGSRPRVRRTERVAT